MKIDLNTLSYKEKINLNEDITIPENYYQDSNILGLDKIHVTGFIRQNEIDEIIINLKVTGIMFLPDSITLEKIPYNLDFLIDEVMSHDDFKQNTLDIIELLWQNIVLEVPIRYTQSDADNLKGDNWQVINANEEEGKMDPRLEKLLDYNKGGE